MAFNKLKWGSRYRTLLIMIEVRRIAAGECEERVPELAAVLVDCVAGNASVSFMAPFTQAQGEEFFQSVSKGLKAGERVLLAAFMDGEVVGTVQLLLAMPPNQLHRADVAKLLVHRRARNQGIAALLMSAVEEAAKGEGRTVLVLDTVVGGGADRLYSRLGWTRVGEIPRYAQFPDQTWCDTAIFWKAVA